MHTGALLSHMPPTSPPSRHVSFLAPTNTNPSLQVKIAISPTLVSLNVTWPLSGSTKAGHTAVGIFDHNLTKPYNFRWANKNIKLIYLRTFASGWLVAPLSQTATISSHRSRKSESRVAGVSGCISRCKTSGHHSAILRIIQLWTATNWERNQQSETFHATNVWSTARTRPDGYMYKFEICVSKKRLHKCEMLHVWKKHVLPQIVMGTLGVDIIAVLVAVTSTKKTSGGSSTLSALTCTWNVSTVSIAFPPLTFNTSLGR